MKNVFLAVMMTLVVSPVFADEPVKADASKHVADSAAKKDSDRPDAPKDLGDELAEKINACLAGRTEAK